MCLRLRWTGLQSLGGGDDGIRSKHRDLKWSESCEWRTQWLYFEGIFDVGAIVAVVEDGVVGDADEEDVAGEYGVVDGDEPANLGLNYQKKT